MPCVESQSQVQQHKSVCENQDNHSGYRLPGAIHRLRKGMTFALERKVVTVQTWDFKQHAKMDLLSEPLNRRFPSSFPFKQPPNRHSQTGVTPPRFRSFASKACPEQKTRVPPFPLLGCLQKWLSFRFKGVKYINFSLGNIQGTKSNTEAFFLVGPIWDPE